MIQPIKPVVVISVLSFFVIVGSSSTNSGAYGETYQQSSWWFNNGDQIAGYVGVTYSYPDLLEAGERIDIPVSLEYIDNEFSRSNYVVFSDVQVFLRDLSDREGTTNLASSKADISRPLRPGEQSIHLLSLETQMIVPGEYAIDLVFSPLFSRGTELEGFSWDSGRYYLQGDRFLADLQPIQLVEKYDSDMRTLTIKIKKPYGQLGQFNIIVDNNEYSMTGGRMDLEFNMGSNHSLIVPKEFPYPDSDKIQAAFLSWSDGINENQRTVTLDKNVELFAGYKTQYYLDIISNFDRNMQGKGWQDSGRNAYFSIDPSGGFGSLQVFDHWEGDHSGKDPFGTVAMDGPKIIEAKWRTDIAFLGGTMGVITAAVALIKLVPPIVKRFRG